MAENLERTIALVWGLFVRAVLLIAVVYLLIRFGPHVLYKLEPIMISVLAALALTYLLLPTVEWLCRKRVSFLGKRLQRILATLLVFLVFLTLVTAGVFLFITPLQTEVRQFSENVRVYAEQLGELFQSALKWYHEQVPAQVRDVIGKLDYGQVLSGLTQSLQQAVKLATSSVGFILELVLIPVLALYFIMDYRSLSRDFYGLVPPHRRREAIRMGRGIGEILQSYIFGQLILCAIAGIVTGVFLALLGLPYVVVLALFAGVTRAIPVIGPVVSGVPIVLVGLLNSPGSLALPIELALFVTVVHFVESKFILPKLIGYRLHLHPATVIIALLIGAQFLGLVGMFVAAPAAAIVRELLRAYYIRPGPQAHRRRGEGIEPPAVPTGS